MYYLIAKKSTQRRFYRNEQILQMIQSQLHASLYTINTFWITEVQMENIRTIHCLPLSRTLLFSIYRRDRNACGSFEL